MKHGQTAENDTLSWLAERHLVRLEPGERTIRDEVVYRSRVAYFGFDPYRLGRLLLTNIRIVSLGHIVTVTSRTRRPVFPPLDVPLAAVESVEGLPDSKFLWWQRLPGFVIRTTYGRTLRFYTKSAEDWTRAIQEQIGEP